MASYTDENEDILFSQNRSYLDNLLEAARNIGETQQEDDDDDVFASNIIEEVKKYPCLWDVKVRSFKETPKKKLAWTKVAEALFSDGMYFYTLYYTFILSFLVVHMFLS